MNDEYILGEKLVLNIRLVLAVIGNWFRNKVPKYMLIVAVIFFGILGTQSAVLIHNIGGFFIPSIVAILNGNSEWPLLLATWSFALLFIAACTQLKYVAFEAALQLHRNFGIKLAP